MCYSIALMQAFEWHVPFISYWAVLWLGLVSTLCRSSVEFDQARFERIAMQAAWKLAWSAPLKLFGMAFLGGSTILAAAGWVCGTRSLEPRFHDRAWCIDFVMQVASLSMIAYLMACLALIFAGSRDLRWPSVARAFLTYFALVFAPVLALAWGLSHLSPITN